MATLTRDELRARAMLMGMYYIPMCGYYFDRAPTTINTKRLDAETLEPLSWEQSIARRKYAIALNKSWWEMTDDERAACPTD